MTPGERSWIERSIASWSTMAAQMQRIACTRQSILARAGALEEVVARLQGRLDAAPAERPPVAIDATPPLALSAARRAHHADMAEYRALRAAGGPRRSPRRNLFREMAEAGAGPASVRGQPGRAVELPIAPPPVAMPFVAGPQMSFEL